MSHPHERLVGWAEHDEFRDLMSRKKRQPRQVRQLDPLGLRTSGDAGTQAGDTLTASFITHQDSVLPVKLNFPPPLADLGSDPSTFDYQWQLLTYAFNLPDPSDFAALRALSLTALKLNPGGSMSPFCDPPTVTSTPHASIR